MNLRKFLVGATASVVMLGAMITTAFAATPNWDITGTWKLDFALGGDHYLHTMTVTTFDKNTGAFSGTGIYDTDSSYTWTVTGTVSGNDIVYDMVYTGTNAGYTNHVIGTITSATTMDGTWKDSAGQEGSWTGTGKAKPVLTTPTDKDQCKKGGWKTFNNPTFKNQGECVAFVEHLLCNKHEKGVVSFSADESLYYNGPTDTDPLYGTGPISFTWNKKTGEVTGGYYTETAPPNTGTVYYNIITGGSVIGDVVNLTFDRTDPNTYSFKFTGTLKDKVLTGQMDGNYLFTATGHVNKDEHGNCQRYDRWYEHYDKDHRGWIWDIFKGDHRNDEHDKYNK